MQILQVLLLLAAIAVAELGPHLLVNDLYLPPPFNTEAVDGRIVHHEVIIQGGRRLAQIPGRPEATGTPMIIKFPPRPPVFGIELVEDTEVRTTTPTTAQSTVTPVTKLVTLTTVDARGATVRVTGGLIPPTRATRAERTITTVGTSATRTTIV